MRKFFNITNKSFNELGVKNYQELWEKVKSEHAGLSVALNTEFTQIKKEDGEYEDNKFQVIMSTAGQDRHGDIVVQNWDLKSFKKNPVFLDSHNYGSIEHILGKFIKVSVKDGVLKGTVEFMLDNPKGLLAYKMAKQGFLNATSVGFIPKEFDAQGRITKSELLENSAVSVPANAEALFEKSIEVTEKVEEEVIEDVKVVEVPEEKEKTVKENLIEYVKNERLKRKQKLLSIVKTLREVETEKPTGETKRKLFRDIRSIL